jgi:hypothetical protein
MPGLRALDRNFDFLPERLRWRAKRAPHVPRSGAAARPQLEPALREKLADTFRPDATRLESLIGRQLNWEL